MEKRLLAVLLSSVVSQALILLLLLPSPPPLSPLSPPLLSLLHLITSAAAAAAAAADSLPRKRKHPETLTPVPSTALILRSSPDHFISSFRMTSTTFDWLAGLLDPLLDCRDPYPIPLPPTARLALALSRLATGAPYHALARHFSVPVPVARFLTKHLCRVLCTNFRFWLAFPVSPCSGCRGAVACTRFAAAGGPIAVQIAADSSSKIISIAAGSRCSTAATVLRSSSLYKDVESGRLLGGSQYLVASANYPLLPWLMVPYPEPVGGSEEEDFNAAHRLMCRPVLRAVVSLRNWGVLGRLVEEEDPKMAAASVGTCAILHNVLLMREDYSALSDDVVECSVSLDTCREEVGVEEGVKEEALNVRRRLAARARGVRESGTTKIDVGSLWYLTYIDDRDRLIGWNSYLKLPTYEAHGSKH